MPDSDPRPKTKPNPIGIGADHGGFELKQHLTKELRAVSYEVVDFGDSEPQPTDDYPDFVVALARAVAGGEVKRGNGHREDELKKQKEEKRGRMKQETESGRTNGSKVGESADNERVVNRIRVGGRGGGKTTKTGGKPCHAPVTSTRATVPCPCSVSGRLDTRSSDGWISVR